MTAAHTTYRGYSGAPGSNGSCTASCHSQYSFTPSVTVTGFPEIYEPGNQYTIMVNHVSDSPINQFNASVRISAGSENGGTISPGDGTEIYEISNETNGVRWSTADTDSGTFVWTAPDSGTGEVRLYWAGLQGVRSFGADTQIVLISRDAVTGIDYIPGAPVQFALKQNYPNPFNNQTMVEIEIDRPRRVDFIITNILGHMVFGWGQFISQPGTINIRWDGTDIYGRALPTGIYFYRLTSDGGNITKKMMLLR